MAVTVNTNIPNMKTVFLLLFTFFIGINLNAQCGNGKTLNVGPQGGCYYYSSSGKKVYVDRSCCNTLGRTNLSQNAVGDSPTNNDDCGYYNNKPLLKGPKGGCYYINKNGNKTYVEKYLCKC